MTDAQLLKAACDRINADFDTLRAHRITSSHVVIVTADFRKYTIARDTLPDAKPTARRKSPARSKK